MKSWIPLFAALLLAGALLVCPHSHKGARVLHADTRCDATSLPGAYCFKLTVFLFDNYSNTNFFSKASRVFAESQGGISRKHTVEINRAIALDDTLTGTYTLSSDCTGSMTTNSHGAGASTLDFV